MAAIPVILNPIAGGGRLLAQRDRLERAAAANGERLEWWLTGHRGHATELATAAARAGRPLVVAFGGDGSYNEVAQGLVGTATALAVLPGGTASVLVRELGLPLDPAVALASLLGGGERDFHVGRTSGGEVVLLMVSAGPDAVVLEHLRPALKRRFGRAGIGLQALLELIGRRPFPIVEVVTGERRESGVWAIVGNCRRYGGDFVATPGADPFAAGFEVVVERGRGRLAALAFALALGAGRHLRRPSVARFAASVVELRTATAGAARYQVDGDLAGVLPVSVVADAASVRVRLPRPDGSPPPAR